MNELETKKLIIQRIVAHSNPVPPNAVQDLLSQSVEELGIILEKLVTTKLQADSNAAAQAQVEEIRRASAFEGAWVHGLCSISLNGKKLVDCDSNKSLMESLLQPHEEPSAAIYSTIALSYPTKFSWAAPQPKQTDADRESEFKKICREQNLSECVANLELFKSGIGTENWAGASQVELTKFRDEAAVARQKWLINSASPSELRNEARYQSATDRAEFQRVEADRRHQVSSQQQAGTFPPLPMVHAETNETIDAKWLRKTSTVNFELFKKLCRRHGSAAIDSRLRGEN